MPLQESYAVLAAKLGAGAMLSIAFGLGVYGCMHLASGSASETTPDNESGQAAWRRTQELREQKERERKREEEQEREQERKREKQKRMGVRGTESAGEQADPNCKFCGGKGFVHESPMPHQTFRSKRCFFCTDCKCT